MAALDDLQFAAVVRGDELRPRVIAQRGDMGEGSEDIDFRQGQGGLANSFSLGRDCGAKFGEEAALDLDNLFLRVENLDLVFFEFGRGKALRTDQRLLPFVVGGDKMQVGLGNFDVVAEDGIELYLQRRDAGPAALALLNLRQNLLTVAGEFAQIVELAIQ